MRQLCLPVVAMMSLLCPFAAPAADLAHIDRTIRKEPKYEHKVKYALLVFGPEAKFKVWLAWDGDVLYVDKNGDGDLTGADKRIVGEKRALFGGDGYEFKAGDITAGTQLYKNLEVTITSLAHPDPVSLSQFEQEPGFLKLKEANPDPWHCIIQVGVPVGRPVTKLTGQYVSHAACRDANGFLQFAAKPSDAPVIHFGGPWEVWPSDLARFIIGRPDHFDARIGTPGHGDGAFAMAYYFGSPDIGEYVPKTLRVLLEVEFHDKDGKTISKRYVTEERC